MEKNFCDEVSCDEVNVRRSVLRRNDCDEVSCDEVIATKCTSASGQYLNGKFMKTIGKQIISIIWLEE